MTHIERIPVDGALARAQHGAYADVLADCGWRIQPAPVAEDCPDSVFIEDAVVVCEDLAVLTRPGAPARRAEMAGAEQAVRPVQEESGCHVVPLGGDQVLIAASAPRTADLRDDLGFTPVVVDISEFEKLEGCVTCLSVLLPGRLPHGTGR